MKNKASFYGLCVMLAGILLAMSNPVSAASTLLGTGDGKTEHTAPAQSTTMLNSDVKLVLSKGVKLYYDADATAVGVCSKHDNGNFRYGGSTQGGSVRQYDTSAVTAATVSGC